MFNNFIALVSVFHILSIKLIRHPFHGYFDFCYLRVVKFFSISCKFSSTPFLCEYELDTSETFDGLLMSMEKLVSDLLSGIMRALRILSYRILLFIYSVRI